MELLGNRTVGGKSHFPGSPPFYSLAAALGKP
jgi:hypothetical protein